MLTLREILHRASERGVQIQRTTIGGLPYLLTPWKQDIPLPVDLDHEGELSAELLEYLLSECGLDPVDFELDPRGEQ